MNKTLQALMGVTALSFSVHAAAQITLHEDNGFEGRSFSARRDVRNLKQAGFNDRASSAVVVGQRWEACEDAQFGGHCLVLRPGQYPSLEAMGLTDRISSVRPLPANEHVSSSDYAPMPIVAQDFRRRPKERLYEVPVSSALAVAGTPAQRCWIEREQVAQQPTQEQQQAGLNIPGAAIGAVIGGILGHQVGGGTGKQIATVGGALGGAALGAQYGRKDQRAQAVPVTQDVRRCDGIAAQATPSYWDVNYRYQGIEHRVQMTKEPGRTITVNARGEPRA